MSDGPAGRRASPAPATHEVHDLLRRLILDGELAPGGVVSQLDLVRRLGVGRTPLREALRLLQREGLVVDGAPGRRLRVSPLTMPDLDDLYALRVAGEAVAVWLTVPALDAGDVRSLERDAATAAGGDASAHRRFHATLRRGAGRRLREHLGRLFEHAERYQRRFVAEAGGLPERSDAEHHEIVAACRERDRERAKAVLVEHIAGTALRLMANEGYVPTALPAALALARADPSAPLDPAGAPSGA